MADLAAGDVVAAARASELVGPRLSVHAASALNLDPAAEIALVGGDLVTARRRAEDTVSRTTGWHLSSALMARARIGIGQGGTGVGRKRRL